MARHRSPQGRRTHLGLPLPPGTAAAGAGGGAALASAPLGISFAPRVIATAVAGGALAAAGQATLTEALPAAADGANVLKLSVQELAGGSAAASVAPLVDLMPAAATVAVEPAVADVADLVKAADLHHRAAAPAVAPPRAPEAIRAPETLRAAEAPQATTAPRAAKAPTRPAAPADVVRMVTGRVSSGFGVRWGYRHMGLDIAAPVGTPIRAPLPGQVVASGPASGFGLWVRVRHDDGTVTTYGHVNRSLVHVGEHVAAGEEIAEVGNRGQSTGPHLHMEVRTPGGVTVNPRPWLDGHAISY